MRMRATRRGIVAAALATVMGVAPLVGAPQIASAATDGTLDTTFNPDGVGADKAIRVVGFAVDGKIYIGGDFTTYRGTPVNALARLNPDGSLDTTFNAGGAGFTKSGAQVLSIHVDTDGDIYVAGNFAKTNSSETADYNTTPLTTNVIRLNSDGTLDTAFDPIGLKYSQLPADDSATVSLVKKIGDIVYVSGSFNRLHESGVSNAATNTSVRGIIGLDATGALDANFGAKVLLTDNNDAPKQASQIHAIPGSTDIYLVGNFVYVKTATEQSSPLLANYVVRVSTNGERVTTYANKTGENVGANDDVTSSAITSDGKLILAGDFTTFNGAPVAGIVRVNSDGTTDSTFTSAGSPFFGPSLTADSAGRMYVTGTMTNFSPTNKNLVRLKADGTLDTDFSLDAQPNHYNSSTAISPNGDVYVYFFPSASQLSAGTKYGTTTVGFIARIHSSAPKTSTSTASGVAPGKPTDIRVKINGTKAKVSWKAPSTGGAPKTYTATAVPTGARRASVSTAKTLTCTVTAPSTSCTISGLSVGMTYGFWVVANNDGGSSEQLVLSKPVLVSAATAEQANTLPATGSSDTTLLMSILAVALMAGGVGLRRLRRL